MEEDHLIRVTEALGDVLYPGLSREAGQIRPLAGSILKYYSALVYKEKARCLWGSFIGGTGTGKSTLFNAFLGMDLSAAGVERPKTRGPLAFEHIRCRPDNRFPFAHLQWEVLADAGHTRLPLTGRESHVQILTHEREDLLNLVLLDTPDLDSVEKSNRLITEDLCLLSDVLVYVTSQEKYADEIPSGFLSGLVEQGKPVFFLLNKADERTGPKELLQFFEQKGISLREDRIWIIPFMRPADLEMVSGCQGFRDFKTYLNEVVSREGEQALRRQTLSSLATRLEQDTTRLLNLGEEEGRAAGQWLKKLNEFNDGICHRFVEEQNERFARERQESLSREIRRLFARYDLLAGPRKLVRGIMLTPLKLLGLAGFTKKRQDDFTKVRQKMELAPMQEALTRLNRLVLEKLSPADEEAPLFQAMRQPGMILSREEMESMMLKEEHHLEEWLKQTFDALSGEIPTGKKWGIYSTSIVWGILIMAFETAVGGGFTVLDAAVDSALAPFVTKGAVELFAAREIRKIAGELSARYREALLSVFRLQTSLWEKCIQSLMFPETARGELEKIKRHTLMLEDRRGR